MARCRFILLSIILPFPQENPLVDKAGSHFIMGQGINGFITGIVRLQEDARFLYDPKTGTLVEKEKRRSF